MLWVAAAGPLANLAMAFGWAFLVKLAWLLPSNLFTVPMTEMGKMGILVNCALMVLNLLPLPPSGRWAHPGQPAPGRMA